MSVSSLSNVSTTSDIGAGGGAPAQSLGKDAFLRLLTTQLQYQDPLNPQKNEEFVAQLAQFSQVEQLTSANDALTQLYSAIASMNNATMTQLLGRTVTAAGDQFNHVQGEDSTLLFDVATNAASATVTITDADGRVVYSQELGGLTEGEGTFTWDGRGFDGSKVPDGTYSFSVSAEDVDGNPVDVQELIRGEVDGMSYETGVPVPSIGGVDIGLGDIIRVESAASAKDEEAG
jgi:flagellar basal-body rod modification protein FlgD